jgi:dihydroxy-acid dehydratase
MDARTFDESKLPSRHVTEGPARAAYRHGQSAGERVALPADGRFSNGTRGFCVGHVGREDDDTIAIEAEKGTLDLELSEAGIERLCKAWKAPPNPYQSGALRK